MLKKVFSILVLCATFSFANFIGITPQELQNKIDKNVKIIDIRTPPEWLETGVVPNSEKIMFFDAQGNYNIKNWLTQLTKIVKDKNQPFVLVCRSGNRTEQVGNFLSKEMKFKNVYHLQHGIKSWIKENRKTIK